jgi:type I restriction enzyme S subunit
MRTVALRHVARMSYGDALPSDARANGTIPVMSSGGVTGQHNKANTAAPCIVVGRKGSHGSVHWSDQEAYVIDTAYWIDHRSTDNHLRWLYYLLSSLDLAAVSQDVGVPGLAREAAYALRVYEPPLLEEQRRIAKFLDAQVTLLDQAVALRQKQLKLLAGRRAAHLSTLIDDLFDQNGAITLRRISKGIEQGTSPDCYTYPAEAGAFGVLKLSAVRAGRFRAEENKALPQEIEPELRYLVRNGDLLMTRGSGSRELVGDVAVARLEDAHLLLPDLIYRVRLHEAVDPHFVCAALRSPKVREEMLASTRGAAGGTIKLRGDDILNLRIPKASRAEAEELARQWRSHGEEMSRLEAAVRRQICLLDERKQALITAAVTGQFDVTTARAVA